MSGRRNTAPPNHTVCALHSAAQPSTETPTLALFPSPSLIFLPKAHHQMFSLGTTDTSSFSTCTAICWTPPQVCMPFCVLTPMREERCRGKQINVWSNTHCNKDNRQQKGTAAGTLHTSAHRRTPDGLCTSASAQRAVHGVQCTQQQLVFTPHVTCALARSHSS
jgi:hypothetical protein